MDQRTKCVSPHPAANHFFYQGEYQLSEKHIQQPDYPSCCHSAQRTALVSPPRCKSYPVMGRVRLLDVALRASCADHRYMVSRCQLPFFHPCRIHIGRTQQRQHAPACRFAHAQQHPCHTGMPAAVLPRVASRPRAHSPLPAGVLPSHVVLSAPLSPARLCDISIAVPLVPCLSQDALVSTPLLDNAIHAQSHVHTLPLSIRPRPLDTLLADRRSSPVRRRLELLHRPAQVHH